MKASTFDRMKMRGSIKSLVLKKDLLEKAHTQYPKKSEGILVDFEAGLFVVNDNLNRNKLL